MSASGFGHCPFCDWVPDDADIERADGDFLMTHYCRHAFHAKPELAVGMKVQIIGHSLDAMKAAWNARGGEPAVSAPSMGGGE